MKIKSRMFLAAILITTVLRIGSLAQTNSPIPLSTAMTQQLQWSAVDVSAVQFKGIRDLAAHALGMRLVVDQPNFAVLVAANGSLFEIYGPGSSDRPWRHGQGGIAFGFLTDNIKTAVRAIQDSGGVLVDDLKVLPKAGADGSDYAYQFFRAPDNRIYAIVQNKDYHGR